MAATWSRQIGLPRQGWVTPYPAAAFLSWQGWATRVRAEEGVVPFVQGTWSCRLERGGGGHSYEKAPMGLLFTWRRGTVVRPDYGGYCVYIVSYLALTRHEGLDPGRGHDEQSYEVFDRVVFPYHASCSFAFALPFVGETSQQRQGARQAAEMGRPFGSLDPSAATAKMRFSAWAEGAGRSESWLSSRVSPRCPRKGRSWRRCQQRSLWHSLRLHQQQQQRQVGSSSRSTILSRSSMQTGFP
ncbi:hypothetical protein Taro_004899 [Colocasia esculenta]|uniref:Uncharacterized protein n=1 Tax=Colocasia esculenta TaxID=4460 RepID=A0A843TQW7_COLES|nr:hypothetical protein [Colocasia esculenta]